MAQNNSEEINFQQYVDGVKQKYISWNFFIAFVQDITNINKLRKSPSSNILFANIDGINQQSISLRIRLML